MAFGGVPIGNMLAQDAANVIGMPNNKGCIPATFASSVTTGAKTITCAIKRSVMLAEFLSRYPWSIVKS